MTKRGITLIEGLIIGIVIGTFIVVLFPMMGCEGLKTTWNARFASSFGSDWLVIQYAQSGDIINYWELKNKSVKNERESDGIFFLDNSNNVIHLSGHYIYVQVANWETVKAKYLRIKGEK